MERPGAQRWHEQTFLGVFRGQPEKEQALLRICLGTVVLIGYIAVAALQRTAAAYDTLGVVFGYVVFGVVTYIAAAAATVRPRLRLTVTTIADQALVMAAFALGGRVALPLLWVVFWFLVGAGCRHGKRSLLLSCAVALAGVAILMQVEPWWRENLAVGWGVMLSIAATSVYLMALVHRLERQAATDPLTGLSNRTRLEQAIAKATAARDDKGQSVLLFIDLDGFKYVNDAYGHAVGDELLQCFANGLQARIRRGDTVARLGGDEFVVLARHVQGKAGARAIADGIHDILHELREIGGHPVNVSASIGVRMLGTNRANERLDVHALMRQADSAMYRAKANGTNKTSFFDETGAGV
ncbi:diguanylate cyclase (GGDEF)-like protein [Paraburkholderia sp. WSM4175]|uniref:diguanylate cyclase domain-containing protein n=1 Tax=Paraburkholderia sp. WSM4175 TaxID=2991072 RepID=UPI003D1A7D0B